MTGLPSPSTLLGVPNFGTWYPGQSEAFDHAIGWFHSSSRFLGLSLPTGSGKTIIALLLAKMSGVRTCILTATKGLQWQYARDSGSLGGVDVRGQNNFKCTLVPTLSAEEGPCHEGLSCSFSRSGGCPYREQLRKALDAQIVVTNYAYYLAQTRFSSGLGEFGLIVLDEAHQSFSALENHLAVYIDRMGIESLGVRFPSLPTSEVFAREGGRRKKKNLDPDALTPPDLWAQWQSWASCSIPVAQERTEELSTEVRELRGAGDPVPGALSRSYRSAKATLAKLQSLSVGSGDWVIQRMHHGVRFTPRWVADKGHTLFQDVPKVMLMSAILSHKTADSIGVPDGDNRSWFEVGSYFPPENTPIYHLPTARINYRSDDYATTIWQARIDQIIQRRLDRKGIVFTVSYERARYLMSRSRFKDIMLTHSTGDVTLVVDRFKKATPPKVLVSPTVTTGWDFPAETTGVRYLIAGKIPYPDTKNLVLQARHEDDKDWSAHLAMETLVQELGRATRCLSWDTQILTKDGWKGPDDIVVGDEVYSLGKHNLKPGVVRPGGMELNPVKSVHVWENDNEMVHITGKSLDVLVTPDHELVILPAIQGRAVKYRYRNHKSRPESTNSGVKSGLKKCRADSLPPRFRVIVSGHCQRERRGSVVCAMGERDLWYFLMGMIISDGSISNTSNRVRIYQSTAKPDVCQRIDDTVDALGLKVTRHTRDVDTTMTCCGKTYSRNGYQRIWDFSGYDAIWIRRFFLGDPQRRRSITKSHSTKYPKVVDKTIPMWVLQQCRRRELRALLDGLMAGDGHWSGQPGIGTYYTSDIELADRVQYLLVMADYRSRVRHKRSQYEVQFSDNLFVDVPKANVSMEPYTGKTWCVSTGLGTIVTRRNGCVAIVGNSATDKVECLIVDDSFSWWWPTYRSFAPKWFQERVRGSLTCVPDPLVD